MRVALAYPYTKKLDHQCNPPLALLYLATSLRDRGADVAVFDADGFDGGRGELVAQVADFRPDVVGLPTFSEELPVLREAARQVRSRLPRAAIVVGGPHATACPHETLDWFPEVDWLLRGEADYTLCELVDQLGRNVARPEVPGLCYRGEDGHVEVPPTENPRDLDVIPIPDRKMLWENYRKGTYWKVGRRTPADMIITSRGCPFNCNFCFKMERGYRARSAKNVVHELVYLASLGITTIDFEDDLFTGSKARCLEICRMIGEAGLKLDLKVRSHVRKIDEELLQAMKGIGVKAVVFGIESGSGTMLKAMNKKATVEDNYRAVRLTKQAGLMCYADLFFGYPGETPETIAETRKFLLKARPTAVNFAILMPFPCTTVYQQAKNAGTLVSDWSPDTPAPFVRLPWISDGKVLWDYVHEILRAFYTHPAVALSMLWHKGFKIGPRQWHGAFQFMKRILRR